MPTKDYAQTMAKYNTWQNESLVTAANTLSSAERRMERGAFFGSIEKTLSHILWGDRIWMHRFAGTPAPDGGILESTSLVTDWDGYRAARAAFDRTILDWTKDVAKEWFDGDLSWYSGAMKREISKPKSLLIVHFFNHQTHHRGQVHAMLTAAGAKPTDTDIPFMPDQFFAL
ncbi:MAG: DinB family protein [Pseudomonadota bacterium]